MRVFNNNRSCMCCSKYHSLHFQALISIILDNDPKIIVFNILSLMFI